jgi:hypothetical protein
MSVPGFKEYFGVDYGFSSKNTTERDTGLRLNGGFVQGVSLNKDGSGLIRSSRTGQGMSMLCDSDGNWDGQGDPDDKGDGISPPEGTACYYWWDKDGERVLTIRFTYKPPKSDQALFVWLQSGTKDMLRYSGN